MKYIFILFLLATTLAHSQFENPAFFEPYNLDFEIGTVGTVPVGWTLDKSGRKFEYKMAVDTSEFASGEQSMVLFNYLGAESRMKGSALQSFNGVPFRGRKIKISANIKFEALNDSGYAFFWIKEFKTARSESNSKMSETGEISSKEWKRYSLELNVSDFAEKLSMGFTIREQGTLGIDNIKIELANPVSYENVKSINLTENKLGDILALAKIYGYLKYFYPSPQIASLNMEGHLRACLDDVISSSEEFPSRKTNDLLELISKNNGFLIGKDTKTSDLNSYEFAKTEFEKYVYCKKYTGAPSEFKNGYSWSDFKNIYDSDRKREAVLMQHKIVSGYEGERFRWSAWVKVEGDGAAAQAQLWTRILSDDNKELNLYMHQNPIRSGDWALYTVDSVLPPRAMQASIGCVFSGEGSAWFDDIEFVISPDTKKERKLVIKNNSFELGQESWSFPASVRAAGYIATIDKNIKHEGLQSLRISSDTLSRIKYPEIGEYFETKISDDLNFSMPMLAIPKDFPNDSLFADKIKSLGIKSLKNNYFQDSDAYSRIGIVSELWNYVRLFSGNKINENLADKIFVQSIQSASKDISKEEFLSILQKCLNSFGEYSARVWNSDQQKMFSLPLLWDFYGDELVVNKVFSDLLKIKKGDVIKSIGGKSIGDILESGEDLFSGANEVLRKRKILEKIKTGNKSSKVSLVYSRDGKELGTVISRNILNAKLSPDPNPTVATLDSNVYYVNMMMFDDHMLKNFVKSILTPEAIVFDARGDSQMSEHFLGYFLNENQKSNSWDISVRTSPLEKHKSTLKIPSRIKAKNIFAGTKVIFLTNENTSGYTESLVGTAQSLGIATVIGENTAGDRSESDAFSLGGGYSFSMPIAIATSPAGTSLHGKMITPDIIVTKRKSDIGNTYDSALQRAIDELKEK